MGTLLARSLVCLLLAATAVSSLSAYPHSLSYFNELAGGSLRAHDHLLGSNIDWGQDLLYLKEWSRKHPEARPLFVRCEGMFNPVDLGIDCVDRRSGSGAKGKAGWYAVSVMELQRWGLLSPVHGNKIREPDELLRTLKGREPVERVGSSIWIYLVEHVANTAAETGTLVMP